MRLLITGADGQLAQEIIRISALKGYTVTAKNRKELDITDFRAVSEAVSGLKPDIVINCAAYNDVDKAESEWKEAYLVNGIGVKYLAIACAKHNTELVHFSSDYVFNGGKKRPYTIADIPSPVNRYGESKLLGEEMLRSHISHYYLIRVSWVFGVGKYSFPLKLMDWAEREKKLRIVDDQVSAPSYTGDVARAVMGLIKTGAYGLYHVTDLGFCSRYEWARFILKGIRWEGELEPAKSTDFPSPAKRPGYSVLDSFPLKETIGYLLPTWEEATENFLKELERQK